MPQETPLIADPKFWISVSSAAIACWSAFNSWGSRRLAARALAIGESQEQRRHPHLGIYLSNGYRRYLPKRQLFGFLVSVSNPTDINNSVALAELQVTYVLDGNIKAVCRIPHRPEIAEGAEAKGATVFSLPARIDAHQTVAGWFLFAVDHELIGGRTIDSHKIILEDSHGVSAQTEPIVVRDWTNEEPKN
jgi:hypothetical protein